MDPMNGEPVRGQMSEGESFPSLPSAPCICGDQSNAAIERLEAQLLSEPQLPAPVTHHFAPGVYMREIFMPAGAFVIGHEHRTEHLNVILTGRASVMMDGV